MRTTVEALDTAANVDICGRTMTSVSFSRSWGPWEVSNLHWKLPWSLLLSFHDVRRLPNVGCLECVDDRLRIV